MYHQCGHITHKVYNTNIFVNGTGEVGDWEQWKERLQAIISQVPDRQKALKPVVQFLVATLAPSQIYCLNLPAAGNKKGEPYLHLCLLIPSRCTTPFTELEPVLELAGLALQKLSCSLHQEGNTKEAIKKGHLFYTLAFREEARIYDSGETVLPGITPEALQTAKEQLQYTFAAYHSKASRFYEAAEPLLVKNDCLALFMLQQAAEMVFRGLLLALNGYDKKTHELRSLKKHLRRCAPGLLEIFPDNTEEETRLLNLLEDAYLQARYGLHFTVSLEDMAVLQERVATLLQTAIGIKDRVLETLAGKGE